MRGIWTFHQLGRLRSSGDERDFRRGHDNTQGHRTCSYSRSLVMLLSDDAIAAKLGGLCDKLFAGHN
jgi:hypothetical protein